MLQTLLQNQPDRFKGHHDRYYSDQDAQRIPEEAADKAHQLISIRTRLLDREQEGHDHDEDNDRGPVLVKKVRPVPISRKALQHVSRNGKNNDSCKE
ncbi:MAG: hypothetical protein ACLRWQ_07585 [Flavonifractor plautii]